MQMAAPTSGQFQKELWLVCLSSRCLLLDARQVSIMLRAIALAVVSRPMGFRHSGARTYFERGSIRSTTVWWVSVVPGLWP